MISLKKYLDMELDEPDGDPKVEKFNVTALTSYRSLLLAIGQSATLVCPPTGVELARSLKALAHRLSIDSARDPIQRTEKLVEVQVREWGSRTCNHFKEKADVAKEVLIALARTAESLGSRDERFSHQFREVTGSLERIADFDDLSQIRSSLVRRVAELKHSVDQMNRDGQELVAQLRAEVASCESRLKSIESLILRDELTGLANRRSVEERIQWNMQAEQEFCVVLIDLNRFKEVNDRYGHLAGDDLLKQFGRELELRTRSGDLVGRWGGDEFIVVLASDVAGARAHLQRISQWIFGKYMVQDGVHQEPIPIQLQAAVGMAKWRAGCTLQQVIAAADAAMYIDKKGASTLSRG